MGVMKLLSMQGRRTAPGLASVSSKKGDLELSLVGDKELEKALHALEAVVQKRVMTKALRVIAKQVLTDAKALVPVDSGWLKRNLKVRAMKRSRRRFGIQVVLPLMGQWDDHKKARSKKDKAREAVGMAKAQGPGNRAMHVEFGTRNMAARPYLRPALNKQRQGNRGLKNIGAVLWEELAKEAKKQAAKNPGGKAAA